MPHAVPYPVTALLSLRSRDVRAPKGKPWGNLSGNLGSNLGAGNLNQNRKSHHDIVVSFKF
jgi:hypothetical protein